MCIITVRRCCSFRWYCNFRRFSLET